MPFASWTSLLYIVFDPLLFVVVTVVLEGLVLSPVPLPPIRVRI